MLSAALTVGLFVAGRFSADLRNFNQVVDSAPATLLTQAVYWLLPHLEPFDVRLQVVHGQPVSMTYLMLTIAYAVLYISGLLLIGMAIFSRREFK